MGQNGTLHKPRTLVKLAPTETCYTFLESRNRPDYGHTIFEIYKRLITEGSHILSHMGQAFPPILGRKVVPKMALRATVKFPPPFKSRACVVFINQ